MSSSSKIEQIVNFRNEDVDIEEMTSFSTTDFSFKGLKVDAFSDNDFCHRRN